MTSNVVLALASALAFAASIVGQQRAVARTSDEDARDGRFFLKLSYTKREARRRTTRGHARSIDVAWQ